MGAGRVANEAVVYILARIVASRERRYTLQRLDLVSGEAHAVNI